MNQIKTREELTTFSQQHRTIITDMYIEGVRDYNGKQGVVSLEFDETGELIGFGYNVLDRRRLKFVNLSLGEQQNKNSVPIYWEIVQDGERMVAAKELFTLPLVGQYYRIG
ncbi:MAG: hypothetical protein HYU71_12440 [Bacteroidetes bacterium]|nr:hypothetical protein [Bacteroidota bacterium]